MVHLTFCAVSWHFFDKFSLVSPATFFALVASTHFCHSNPLVSVLWQEVVCYLLCCLHCYVFVNTEDTGELGVTRDLLCLSVWEWGVNRFCLCTVWILISLTGVCTAAMNIHLLSYLPDCKKGFLLSSEYYR